MRQVFLFLFLYLILIIQTAFLPVGPDLVLLTLLVCAFHQTRLTATLLGLLAGFFLDLTAPAHLGIQTITLGTISYSVAVVRDLFYRTRWHTPIFAGISLGLKELILQVTAAKTVTPLPLIVTLLSTLLISPFAENILQPLFFSRRKK